MLPLLPKQNPITKPSAAALFILSNAKGCRQQTSKRNLVVAGLQTRDLDPTPTPIIPPSNSEARGCRTLRV
jgi:hypothetical protein